MKKGETKRPLVVTHSGNFHTDDVFAVAALSFVFGNDYDLLRSREQVIIEKGDYVVDIGGVYDPKKNRFDHHQEGGAGKRPNGIPYSSFGLVWKKFGKEISGSEEVADEIDSFFAQPIDMSDNGIDAFTTTDYGIFPITLQAVTNAFRPVWDEHDPEQFDLGFREAVNIARAVLERIVVHTVATKRLKETIREAYDKSTDKRIIVIHKYIQFRHLPIEQEDLLFIISPSFDDSSWKVEAIKKGGTFESRQPFPKSWAGKQDKELANESGVSDALFCHNARFLASAGSQEGALALAKKALEERV